MKNKKRPLHFVVPVTVYHSNGKFYSRKQTFLFDSLAEHFSLNLYTKVEPLPAKERHLYSQFSPSITCTDFFVDCTNQHFFTNWQQYKEKLRTLPEEDLYFFIFPMGLVGMALCWILKNRKCIIWIRSDTVAVHNSRYLRFYDGTAKGVIRTIINPLKNIMFNFVAKKVTKNNLVFYSGNITINPEEHRNQYEVISPPDFSNRPIGRTKYPQHRLCFVGSEEPRKGLTVLLRALRTLPDPQQYQLEIIGLKNLQHPRNKKLAENLAINFHGAVYDRKNVYKIISQCDILVMPSFAEKQGKVQLEAMAVGTVPICSDSGGTYCTIKNLHNGILVAPGNHDELASSITKLFNKPKLYCELQKNGIDYSKRLEDLDIFYFIYNTAERFFTVKK